MHSGKDAGLSGAFGVGTGQGSLGGGSLVERNLNRWTVGFAIAFAVNTIILLKAPSGSRLSSSEPARGDVGRVVAVRMHEDDRRQALRRQRDCGRRIVPLPCCESGALRSSSTAALSSAAAVEAQP